jgi:F-type H+-transporting ATPase subunit delta
MAAVASRYARAMADALIDARADLMAAMTQLRSLVVAYQESPELREVWQSPAISSEQKHKVVDALATRLGVNNVLVRNFIAVLIRQDRIGLLPEIAVQVETELNHRIGRIDAEIISARELGPEQRARLMEEISRLTGKTVIPRYVTDRSLIGGVTVRVGSTIYDGSVRGQLQRMRQQLTES